MNEQTTLPFVNVPQTQFDVQLMVRSDTNFFLVYGRAYMQNAIMNIIHMHKSDALLANIKAISLAVVSGKPCKLYWNSTA